MRTVLTGLLGLLMLVCPASPGRAGDAVANPDVRLRLVGHDPADNEMLARRDMLYLRIAYDSPVPVRVVAKGFFGGVEARGNRASSPAPVYPAGKHEALAWMAFSEGAALDEIRLIAHDAAWNALATVSIPMSVSWGARGRKQFASAPWVRSLGQRQLALIAEQSSLTPGSTAGNGAWLAASGFLSVPAYLALQAWLLTWLRRGWRAAAALPLLVTVPMALYTVAAFAMGASLWPLTMVLIAPLALLYLGVVAVCRMLAGTMPPSRAA